MLRSVRTQVVRALFLGLLDPSGKPVQRAFGALLCLALVALASGCSDIPQVMVELSGDTTTEAGTSVSISLSLAENPRALVTIEAISSNPSEGVVSTPVRFDATNWSTPQLITVTGVADGIDDGDVFYAVRLIASSSRTPDEDPVEVALFSLLNRDVDDFARFVGLGDLPGGLIGSYVSDVTPSGEVIVGTSEGAAGRQGVRWQYDQITALANELSSARGVSPDGRYIAGGIGTSVFSGGFWHGTGPFVSVYEPAYEPLAPAMYWMVRGIAALDDGQIIGDCVQQGISGSAGFDCRFTPPDTLAIVANMTHVFDADAQGNRVGTRLPSRYEASFAGAQAYFNERALPYPEGTCMRPNICHTEAHGLTTGGGVIVGIGRLPPVAPETSSASDGLLETAFTYSTSEGMLRLPDLVGGDDASGAYAVTEDGRVVGGFGDSGEGPRATLWIDRLARTVEDLLASAGASPPTGWRLLDVTDFSADGRTLIGNGLNADGNPEGYRIDFPIPLGELVPAALAAAR
jgi:uncharacterized membrane protein